MGANQTESDGQTHRGDERADLRGNASAGEGPGAPPAADAAHPTQTRAAREATYRQMEPAVYRYVERNRYGREQVRYRTHMGQICRKTTTTEQAVAMWERCQSGRKRLRHIGPLKAAKLNAMLTPADRAAYDELVGKHALNVRELQRWLEGRGYTVSLGSVQAHREHFLLALLDVQQAARMAGAFTQAARDRAPVGAIADAAAGRTEQLFMEMLFEMKPEARRKLTVEDWLQLQKASGGLVAGRRMMEQMRADFDDRARRAAEAAEKAAGRGKSGKGGVAVANRVREILGIPLLDADGNEVDDEPPDGMAG